jgi:hypothetical protein
MRRRKLKIRIVREPLWLYEPEHWWLALVGLRGKVHMGSTKQYCTESGARRAAEQLALDLGLPIEEREGG